MGARPPVTQLAVCFGTFSAQGGRKLPQVCIGRVAFRVHWEDIFQPDPDFAKAVAQADADGSRFKSGLGALWVGRSFRSLRLLGRETAMRARPGARGSGMASVTRDF